MGEIATVAVNLAVTSEQARMFRALTEVLGESVTASLDESEWATPDTWRLNFGSYGDGWVYIYPDGTTDEDVLRDYFGADDADLGAFKSLPNGMMRVKAGA